MDQLSGVEQGAAVGAPELSPVVATSEVPPVVANAPTPETVAPIEAAQKPEETSVLEVPVDEGALLAGFDENAFRKEWMGRFEAARTANSWSMAFDVVTDLSAQAIEFNKGKLTATTRERARIFRVLKEIAPATGPGSKVARELHARCAVDGRKTWRKLKKNGK